MQETAQGSNKIVLSFDVKHSGSGSVFKDGSGCPENDRANEEKVWLEVDKDSSLSGLACTGLSEGTATTGYVNLMGGERTIRCTYDVTNAATDYEQSISFEMKYAYSADISSSITIRASE